MEKEKGSKRAILLMSSQNNMNVLPDVSRWLADNQIEIDTLNHHTEDDMLYVRMELNLDHTNDDVAGLKQNFANIAKTYQLDWDITDKHEKKRAAVFVSKMDQHLIELMTRIKHGELPVSIEMVIGNHRDVEEGANQYGIPFHYIPITSETKQEAEQKAMSIIDGKVDFIILAKYMQILTSDFVARYENKVINIHHSLLPAFVGANPYEKAHERGVKLIGATSHYVTSKLDAGPIIHQGVEPIDHTYTVKDLKVLGSHVEKNVLAHAVTLHANDRIILSGNKTIIL